MSALAAALALLSALLPPVASGNAFHYERPGALARVAAVRHMPVAWNRVTGLASVPDCGRVDVTRPWLVVARWQDGSTSTLQVTDCSDPADLPAQRRKGLVLEVDAGTARSHGWYWPPGPGKAPVMILGYGRVEP